MITHEQYLAILSRQSRTAAACQGKPVEREKDLHAQIHDLCRSRSWMTIYSRMDKPATTACGTPDFVILMPGKVALVECKSRTGKLTPDQRARLHWAQSLGHIAIEARCIEDVLSALQ